MNKNTKQKIDTTKLVKEIIDLVNTIYINYEVLAEKLFLLINEDPEKVLSIRKKLKGKFPKNLEDNLILLAKGLIIPELITDNSLEGKIMKAFDISTQKKYYLNCCKIDVHEKNADGENVIRELDIHNMYNIQLKMVFDTKNKRIRSVEEQISWVSNQSLKNEIKNIKANKPWKVLKGGLKVGKVLISNDELAIIFAESIKLKSKGG
jgi:hypothetical protein